MPSASRRLGKPLHGKWVARTAKRAGALRWGRQLFPLTPDEAQGVLACCWTIPDHPFLYAP